MFHPFRGVIAWGAAIAQVQYESRIMRGQPAERGRSHAVVAQENLYLANEHW